MHRSVGSHRARSAEGGFTVLELTIAIGIAAFAFSAIAALLMGSLKALSVQKARTQGNEVATQGIEDLQRLRYNDLGLCAKPDLPPAVAPPGLSDTVLLSNCPAPLTPSDKFEPCSGLPPAPSAVPAERYTCTRLNIDYDVKRYISYDPTDVNHTKKRLAVFVKWRDSVGVHEVSQQSSLRIPSRNALVGLAPPTITSAVFQAAAPASVTLDSSGVNASTITISAVSNGLGTGDSVLVSFSTLEGGQPRQSTVALTYGGGSAWSGSIAAGSKTFGKGTQFITFTAIRKSDGKVNSLVYPPNGPPVSFVGGPPTPVTASFGTTTLTSAAPPKVDINASGNLAEPSFTFTVTTTDISPDDGMVMVFLTQTGAVAFALSPSPLYSCAAPPGTCAGTWTGTIDQGAGFNFLPGVQKFYFMAVQGIGPNPLSLGHTAAVASANVTFE